MTQLNDGGPAFPSDRFGEAGMSLRDWFAGQALAGQAHRFAHPHDQREILAKDCYEIADAMIAAREAKSGN